jgi:hypothetical protein
MTRGEAIRFIFQPPPGYESWRQWLIWMLVFYGAMFAVFIGILVALLAAHGIYVLLKTP